MELTAPRARVHLSVQNLQVWGSCSLILVLAGLREGKEQEGKERDQEKEKKRGRLVTPLTAFQNLGSGFSR